MLDSDKDSLNKKVEVKSILTKDVNIKDFLEMEIEVANLKSLLATEIKLREFLVQEIDLSNLLSRDSAALVDKKKTLEKNTSPEYDVDYLSEFERRDALDDKLKPNLPAYDLSLLETLTEEHRKIRFIFNRIMSYAIDKKYQHVAGQLEVFNSEIREHYQKADTELYAYLKKYVQIKYPRREKAFSQLSLEMKNLSIEIFYTISQSPNIPLTDKTYDGFMKEFINVGKYLNTRIEREQNVLFKMYRQTKEVKSISSDEF